jgi:[CysO sulfur-carrier protein]-S-L-cysteine hydrolase
MTSSQCLPRSLINQLLHHAQQSATSEVCGLIGAESGIPLHCYPITNIAAEPQRLFTMDPAQQIAALRSMRERGEQLFAIYHSHPNSPPLPSRTDLAQSNYPEALYLIISLQTQGVLEMRGFRLIDGAVIEIALEITE